MFCKNCGSKIIDDVKFCGGCGQKTSKESENIYKEIEKEEPSFKEEIIEEGIIKCGNCEYIGKGQKARSTWAIVLVWICVVFAPMVTIIYYLATSKYKCPQCKSTFLGIKNEEGKFVGQNGSKGGRIVLIFICILIGIAIIGILASVVLASLNSARSKAQDASIKANLSSAIAQAEIYYDVHENSYAGVCTNIEGILSFKNSASESAGGSVICNDTKTAWAMSSSLKTKDGSSWCVDSMGSNKEVLGVITNQTSCYFLDTTNDYTNSNNDSLLPNETGLEYCNRTQGGHSTYDLTNNSCGCEKGYRINSENKCVSLNVFCSNKWTNSYSIGIDKTTGENTCDCKSGYTWNSGQTACITISQYCNNKFPNSYYDGKYCNCKSGYTWNSTQTGCY